MFAWIMIAIMAAIGAYDLYLVWEGKPTLSQMYRKLFPQKIDYFILVVFLVLVWAIFSEQAFAPVMIGVIAGHLFWR